MKSNESVKRKVELGALLHIAIIVVVGFIGYTILPVSESKLIRILSEYTDLTIGFLVCSLIIYITTAFE